VKRIISVLLAAIMVFSLASCVRKGANAKINVYFKNTELQALSAESVEYVGSNNTVDMARFAMEKLEEGPKDSNNVAVLPEGTRFNSVSVADGLARVDFSKQFINASGVDEIMARFSGVSTLCDIPGIEKVLITVGGEALTSSSTGEEVGVLSKNDIVYDTDMIPANSSEKTTLKLYFANSDATALKAEERQVETQNSLSMEKTIITELLKGPVSKELVAVIPSETKLLNLETNNGVCFVNFSSEFVTKFTGGTNTGMLIVYSIVNSLTELDDVDSVQILIEGKTGVEFGDFVFDEPIERSKNIVQKD
jgi:germination protein M